MNGVALFCLMVVCLQYAYGDRCNSQFYQHYPHKNCSPVLGQDGCPVRFECHPIDQEFEKKCLHEGKWYSDRDYIPHECGDCQCRVDEVKGAAIECPEVDCPWEVSDKNCYLGYRKVDQCCPGELCPEKDESVRKTCNHNGTDYRFGAYIKTAEPCESCVCTGLWSGPGGPGCKRVDCLTGIEAPTIRQGCLVVYSERGCCSIDRHCGSVSGAKPVEDSHLDKTTMCRYRDNFYMLGSVVHPVGQKDVECKCNVPPDFTCIKKR